MKILRTVGLTLVVGSALAGGCSNDPAPATPTVVPTPTPTPSPTPDPGPVVQSCTLPPMPDCGEDCCRKGGGEAMFTAEIAQAQEAVRQSRPDAFRPNGSLRISEVEYTAAVAVKLTEMFGLCARGGDEKNPRSGGHSISSDEVGVKRDNGTSQNVDIIIGSSLKPAILSHHTCRPASF